MRQALRRAAPKRLCFSTHANRVVLPLFQFLRHCARARGDRERKREAIALTGEPERNGSGKSSEVQSHYCLPRPSTKTKLLCSSGSLPGAIKPCHDRLTPSLCEPPCRGARSGARTFIEELIEGELGSALARPRYGRRAKERRDAVTDTDYLTLRFVNFTSRRQRVLAICYVR